MPNHCLNLKFYGSTVDKIVPKGRRICIYEVNKCSIVRAGLSGKVIVNGVNVSPVLLILTFNSYVVVEGDVFSVLLV